MKSKVSIREIVASKIVISGLVTGYYWMWSRSDWKPEYEQYQRIWGFILVLTLLLHYYRVQQYKKENVDELAEKNLQRCDAICLRVFVGLMVVTAYVGGILGHINVITPTIMGWLILGCVVAISILRTVLFYLMDTKGY